MNRPVVYSVCVGSKVRSLILLMQALSKIQGMPPNLKCLPLIFGRKFLKCLMQRPRRVSSLLVEFVFQKRVLRLGYHKGGCTCHTAIYIRSPVLWDSSNFIWGSYIMMYAWWCMHYLLWGFHFIMPTATLVGRCTINFCVVFLLSAVDKWNEDNY